VNVLLLHAFPLDGRMWAHQLHALHDHDVVTPTLYGLGGSMDEWADAVLKQVDGAVVVVGASMGGYCALAIARRAPERLRGLVLGGARAGADTPERRAGRAETVRLIRERGVEALWDDMRPKLLPEDASTEAVESAWGLAVLQQPDQLVVGVEAIRDRPDSTNVVRGLRVPLLVVAGTEDPFLTVDEASEIAATAPNGRAVVLDGAGHLPSLERPEEYNSLIRGFLAGLE
jgi:pimeloyl-ACP methyl ester carboxylesterase